MDPWILLGLTAGFFTTVGYVPQIVMAYRTKRMNDCSMLMPVVLGTGTFLWTVYGLLLDNIAIFAWNAISFLLNVTLISMKLRYRAGCPPEAPKPYSRA